MFGNGLTRITVCAALLLIIALPAPTQADDRDLCAAAASSAVAKGRQGCGEDTLDLEGLKDKIKETEWIELGQKFALRGRVKGLMKNLKEFHRNDSNKSLKQLEEEFDGVLSTVLDLLDGKDPTLQHEIAVAGPLIWETISVRESFLALK